jgi:ankyrin repeat protein
LHQSQLNLTTHVCARRCAFVVDDIIRSPAAINAVDHNGDTALHRAVYRGQLNKVKLFLKKGANADQRNNCGNTALLTAALTLQTKILDFLINDLQPDLDHRADLYSLMAASFVDWAGDRRKAMSLWLKAAGIRATVPALLPPNHAVYGERREVFFAGPLGIIAANNEAIDIQAMLVYERVLGRDHPATVFGVLSVSACYSPWNYQRFIDISAYGFQLRRNVPSALLFADEDNYISTLVMVCEAFLRKYDHDRRSDIITDFSARFDEVRQVLEMTVAEAKEFVCLAGVTTTSVVELMKAIVYLVDMASLLATTSVEKKSTSQLIRLLVLADLKTTDGRSLLHLAADPDTTSIGFDRVSVPVNSRAVQALLDGGFAVNATDNEGNTAMHVAVMARVKAVTDGDLLTVSMMEVVVDELLKGGAAIDMANCRRQTVLQHLPPNICVLKYVSLQCLAARAIRRHEIPYHKIVPEVVERFIDLH